MAIIDFFCQGLEDFTVENPRFAFVLFFALGYFFALYFKQNDNQSSKAY